MKIFQLYSKLFVDLRKFDRLSRCISLKNSYKVAFLSAICPSKFYCRALSLSLSHQFGVLSPNDKRIGSSNGFFHGGYKIEPGLSPNDRGSGNLMDSFMQLRLSCIIQPSDGPQFDGNRTVMKTDLGCDKLLVLLFLIQTSMHQNYPGNMQLCLPMGSAKG